MPETDDIQLLREFAERKSDAAFATLVTRYVNLVYCVGLRQTGNFHAAEEITQAVFIILARKAGSLGPKTVLSGWLYQTARLTAANYRRTELRRARREQEAYMQSVLNQTEPDVWAQIAPLLDDAMGKLGEKDRHAILLRFFEDKSLAEVGTALGASEDAAKMRVNRALEKLRKFFTKRGVTLTATLIANAVSANSVQAAPAGLAVTVTAAAAKGAAVGSSTLTLVKGALKLMAWTKAKMVVVLGTGALLALGTATAIIKEGQTNLWLVDRPHDVSLVDKVPPQVKILPTKFDPNRDFVPWGISLDNGKAIGIGVGIEFIAQAITGTHYGRDRMILQTGGLLTKRFDVIANLPSGSREALVREARKVLGVVVRREMRDTDVLLLKMNHLGAPGLLPGGTRSKDAAVAVGKLGYYDSPIHYLVQDLESHLLIPILDKTGLTNRYDMEFSSYYSNSPDERMQRAQQAMLRDLGLELVPSREKIEMLVVERVKN